MAPLTLVAALAGCGQGEAQRNPDLTQLPLVPGANVVTQVRQCDTGSGAFCALELVVVDPAYQSSDTLLLDERAHLRKLGWTLANGDISDETAANSPGHNFRLTFATALGDLKGIDLGWIRRPRSIALALSGALFDRSAAMSMSLEVGAS